MKLTPEMLTGKSREHLINLPTPILQIIFASRGNESVSRIAAKCDQKWL